MGTFSCLIEILSADGSRSETVDALVDTGSTYTCLPATLLHELGIVPYRRIQSELPDGSIVEDAVGEARIRVEGIERSTIVIFAGEGAPAQLGAYTLEGALLVVDPVRQRLAPTHALRMGLTVIDEDDVVRRANAAAEPPRTSSRALHGVRRLPVSVKLY